MSIAVAGFLLGISLIVAIGPQNALIIRQGIKREAMVLVIAICMLSDIFLIFGGTAGVGAIIEKAPLVLVILKWVGATYLAWFGFSCFKDAIKPKHNGLTINNDTGLPPTTKPVHTTQSSNSTVKTKILPTTQVPPAPVRPWVKPALAALAFTWLNPGTYIDTLIMLGGIANQHGESGRWVFAAGAFAASMTWFPVLGFFSAKFSTVLSKPSSWQIINAAIGCIMVLMCIRLIMH